MLSRIFAGAVLLSFAASASAQVSSFFTRAIATSCGNQQCTDVHPEIAIVPGANQHAAACIMVWNMIYVFQGDSFHHGDATGCYYFHDHDPQTLFPFTGATTFTAPDPRNNGCCDTSVGNPINPGSGNKYETETDYVMSGPFPLRFERMYNLHAQMTNARFGNNWSGSYDRSLVLDSNGQLDSQSRAIARRPDGKVLFYQANGDGFSPTAGVVERLTKVRNAGGLLVGFNLTTAADETERYDVRGKLLAITNRAGLSHTMAYNSVGLLSSVTDSFGRSLSFTYGASNRIVSITVPGGGVVAYGYDDTNNNLTSVTFPGGSSKVYHYNEAAHVGAHLPNALTGITDENGSRFATFKYDQFRRAIQSEHAGGAQRVQVSYDGTESTVIDASGTSRLHSFQNISGLAKNDNRTQPAASGGGQASTAATFDGNGNATSRVDFNGNRTTYTYDLFRNLETSRTEGLTAAGGTTPQTRTISTQWHAVFRLPTVIAEPLRITTNVYDLDGTQCGARGALCSKTLQATTDVNGSQGFSATATGAPRTWTYTYNTNGDVLTVNGPRTDITDVTIYTYHANNDAVPGKRGNVAAISNASGHVTTVTAYNAHGQPLTMVDPNGLTTTMTYDARQRLKTRTAGSETTTYDYDNVGQLTKVTLPDGSFLSYTYDAAHRLTGMQDNLDNRISYTLDGFANRTQEQVFDPANQLAQTRSRVFNNLNRLFRELGATGQTTEYAYDNQGNVASVKDPLNRVAVNQYDVLNRLAQVTDPASGLTQYAYNGADALIQVTDPRNLVTGYAVDGLGNLIAQASPDIGTTANTYDAAGNLLTQTDAKGQATSYAYDVLNRVTLITFHDGSKQAYAYDQGSNGVGRLASITETNPANQVTSAIAYAYDQHGRVTSETRTPNGVQHVLGYAYDAFGRLAGLTYPSGRTVGYGFDALGRVSQIVTTKPGEAQETVVSGVAYHPFGGVRSFTLGDGLTYTRGIDLDGRIASYTGAAQSLAIGYDAASRIAFISDIGNPANTNTYGYDSLDRLTSAVTPGTPYAYGYDGVGNRLSRTAGSGTDSYVYSGTSNRIASITPASGPVRSFAFDPNGSTTADGLNAYAYDVRGRMVQATSSIGATSYQVNALGQRIRKSNSLGDTVFHYDTQGRLIAETGPSGVLKRELIYLGDIPVGVVQ